ncbi:hypothetical protein [Sulfitobacter donghicola]|uniref:Uncharacterized protein n=1 Tax=Sulfitobacter donghicola DSW-25 = KCTC 12864 = JCM 14565 TaxID=1300350 RepID=A0A073IID1_9RHOB|nr:hypothetical protein [Sulfitobacter donghicola]KEJ89281.1 hypothetical protein DSW25_09670 [Sulfitobacter donghicola DSW-25 = KCTC 12864 = JCM 14565]KIN69082.1 hypothetical protein Z948_2817 [Sulfitobacter donghicola DSW-25 = KCTC 12864 = JCM 14565]
MIRVLSIALFGLLSVPAVAETAKEKDCGYQGDVVASVQAARIERVGEKKLAAHIAETSPEWPEKYNAIVPLVAPWVYGMKMAEVKSADLAAAWKELCLTQ